MQYLPLSMVTTLYCQRSMIDLDPHEILRISLGTGTISWFNSAKIFLLIMDPSIDRSLFCRRLTDHRSSFQRMGGFFEEAFSTRSRDFRVKLIDCHVCLASPSSSTGPAARGHFLATPCGRKYWRRVKCVVCFDASDCGSATARRFSFDQRCSLTRRTQWANTIPCVCGKFQMQFGAVLLP